MAMITRITGTLTHVLEDRARLEVGGLEYEVLISESTRRQLQTTVGDEISLHTLHYFEGNPAQGKMYPRLLGFVNNSDIALFDLLCSVDKVGVKKALKAMDRPARDIANAIQREDAAWLTTLPGIGAPTAEQMVTKLKRKVTKLAFSQPSENGASEGEEGDTVLDGNLIDAAYQGLMGLGLSPVEARTKLDGVLSKKKFEKVEEIIEEVFKN